MVGKVHWHMQALVTALQDPHKNVLVVFGHHNAAKKSFRMAIDELFTNAPEYPCQINHQNLAITMAEGGRIHFMTMAQTVDAERVCGYRFSTAIYDESFEFVKNPDTRGYIRAKVAAHIR